MGVEEAAGRVGEALAREVTNQGVRTIRKSRITMVENSFGQK